MRKTFLIFALFLFSASAIAQSPKQFKYQGLARDSSGNPISNDTIALRISIHQGTPNGNIVYKETHNPITNEFGSFNTNIGSGIVISGVFSTIAWGRNIFFQEVEMDITGGSSFVSMGTSQYMSVPYALSADSAKFGTAPFWVQNNASGNDSASVAIFAFANGGAPAFFCKNFSSGKSVSIYAESGNGKYFESDSSGISTNGNLNTNGITINGSAGTPGQILGIGSSGNLAWLPSPGFSNFQVFNSSGTFTVSGRTIKVMVEVWGAGGAGSGTPGGGSGSGGGGGGYGKSIFSVLPGTQFTVTVGSGGTGVINGTGNAGGVSSFDAFLSVSGGGGGPYGGGHGAGGSASGMFSINGGTGANGGSGSGGAAGGGGGAGHPGGGGQGTEPGGGGSGTGVPGTAGGNGGNGRVVVWW